MSNTYLAHHGIKGQKWGVRRFQFLDGLFTPLGKLRYNSKNIDFQEIDYNNYNLNDPEQYEEDLKYLRSLIESGFLESIGEDTSEGTFWALIASPTGLSTYTQTVEREYVRSGMKKELARSEARKQTMNIVGFLADRSKELENEKSGRKKKTTHAPHTHNQVYRNSVKKNSEYVVKKSKESGMNWTVSHSYPNNTYLAHHGVKGQKHGVRQWQNPDGSLTPAGRIHYGVGAARDKVGAAAKSIGKAIRKKVKPTNAELNAQIRKQKAKNLNKQKRRELRDLKRGIDSDASSSSSNAPKGQHKRFSEMSDQDIQDRIKRLKSEIELADLERTKSMGPGQRLVDKAIREAGQQALKNIVSNALTTAGNQAVDKVLKSTKEAVAEQNKKKYETELAERKAKKELKDFKAENPEGLGRFAPSARKAAKEKKAKEAQEKADAKLKEASERSSKQATITKNLSSQVKAYVSAGFTEEEIAKKLGLSVGSISYYANYSSGGKK